MNFKKSILSLFISLTSLICLSQTVQEEVFNGVVLDAQTNDPMAYVYIYLPDYKEGTITDLKGGFTLTIKNFLPYKNKVIAAYVGFNLYFDAIVEINSTRNGR